MNIELLNKWVEALESGKYAYNRGCLRSHENFCAIGVLCDIVDPNGWMQPPNDEGVYMWDHNCMTTPSRVSATLAADFSFFTDVMVANDESKNNSYEAAVAKIKELVE